MFYFRQLLDSSHRFFILWPFEGSWSWPSISSEMVSSHRTLSRGICLCNQWLASNWTNEDCGI